MVLFIIFMPKIQNSLQKDTKRYVAGWRYTSMVLTTMQLIGLATFPLSFASLTLGSTSQQHLEKEVQDNFGILEKLKVFPFFFIVCLAKVWILSDAMWAMHQVHPYLASIPVLLMLAVQTALHVKMSVKWREVLYSAIGNLSSMRRPVNQDQCDKLFKIETVLSTITYSFMIATSFVIRFSGIWYTSGPVDQAAPFISLVMLIVYLAVTKGYLWIGCLSRTLFSDQHTNSVSERHQDNFELDTLHTQDNATVEGSRGRAEQLEEVEEGEGDSMMQRDNTGHLTSNSGQKMSSWWLALKVVLALLIQSALIGYLRHQSGRMKSIFGKYLFWATLQ